MFKNVLAYLQGLESFYKRVEVEVSFFPVVGTFSYLVYKNYNNFHIIFILGFNFDAQILRVSKNLVEN